MTKPKRKRENALKKFDTHEESDEDSDVDENESLLAIKERLLRSKRNRPKSPTPSADLREKDIISILFQEKR